MRKIYIWTIILLGFSSAFCADYSVQSPDGKLEALVSDGEKLTFTVKADGKILLDKSQIAMLTDKGDLGINAVVKNITKSSNNSTLETVYGIRKEIKDIYNQINLDFGSYSLQVRAYDEAVAYRFVTNFGEGAITVKNEILTFPSVKGSDKVVAHLVKSDWYSCESPFTRINAEDMKKHFSASMPFIIQKEGMKLVLVESGLSDYPSLRVAWAKDSDVMSAYFAKCPAVLSTKRCGFELQPDSVKDYIANTDATRDFPWRAFIVARNDVELADNNTVYKLARPCAIGKTNWISYGASVWDWWVNWNTQDVDFRAVFNEDMCRYYVDFAAENNIPFVTFDAGWHIGREDNITSSLSKKEFRELSYKDETFLNGKPHVDIPEMVKYAHGKGIKVFLWVYSKVMYNYPRQALEQFKSWGVDGLKIDFSDRDDQLALRHYENISRLAAEHRIMVDWHGCPSMAGMERTYPNIVNFEGVKGGEFNKFKDGVTPSHNVDIVFTRMLIGPIDYTPGGMRNVFSKDFSVNYNWPNVMGTRSAEAAKYVLYYAPLQMLSDAPSEYRKAKDFFDFIAHVPTSWDDTKALEGKLGDIVVVARRKGDIWYVGCMSGIKKEREVSVELSKFLPKDTSYSIEILRDTVNTHKLPISYKIEKRTVSSDETLKIKVAMEGGFAIKLTPKN